MASINFERKIIYYHVHKAGGTFIQNVLENDFDFIGYNFLAIEGKQFFNYHKESTVINLKLCSDDIGEGELDYPLYKQFTFVRNPYTRFISGCFYSKGRILKNNKTLTYDFFDSLSDIISRKEELDNVTYSHIFKTQHQMLVNDQGQIRMDHIGKFENLIPDLQKILSCYFEGEIVIENKKINENPIKYGDYRQYYTVEILNFINSWFDSDFSSFGYEKVFKIENLP